MNHLPLRAPIATTLFMPTQSASKIGPKKPLHFQRCITLYLVLSALNAKSILPIARPLSVLFGQKPHASLSEIGQNPSYAGVITRFQQSIREKKPPTIFGDDAQTRDFIHVSDVANAIQKTLIPEATSLTPNLEDLTDRPSNTLIFIYGVNVQDLKCFWDAI